MFIASYLSKLTPADIVGIMTIVSGLVVAVIKASGSKKTSKTTAEQAQRNSILSGYGQIVKDLQTEIERLRHQYIEDLSQWQKEKEELEDRINKLEGRIFDLTGGKEYGKVP